MFGSDQIVEWLADADIEYVALNPGATLRGLHDSLVRASKPLPILAMHEETAVGIAHGYAKATGRPMAVMVHDLVGLQHASMAIFNAWVDRTPMLVIGGSGPRDEQQRRPWLDWIHTGAPQASIVRDFVKWDAEPASMFGVRDALYRGLRYATTGPCGPVYISVDTALQEGALDEFARLPWMEAGDSPILTAPPDVVADVAAALANAARPVIVLDRPARGLAKCVAAIAQATSASVVDMGGGANFPTGHWANQSLDSSRALREADLVVALEVRDLAWATTSTDTATRATEPRVEPGTPIVAVSLSELRHRGFLIPEAHVEGARYVLSDPVVFADQLLQLVVGRGVASRPDRQQELRERHSQAQIKAVQSARDVAGKRPIHPAHLAACLWEAVKDGPWQLANGHLGGWPQKLWGIADDSHYLGRSGGHGLGYGLPASLGAALAANGGDALVVDVQPDGDLMYTASALWTAAHHRLPLLIVMFNNRTYGKDELHQSEMARMRGRSADAVPIGIRLDRPPVDFAMLAKSQGVDSLGPVDDPAELQDVLVKAASVVRNERRPLLVDVICGK